MTIIFKLGRNHSEPLGKQGINAAVSTFSLKFLELGTYRYLLHYTLHTEQIDRC